MKIVPKEKAKERKIKVARRKRVLIKEATKVTRKVTKENAFFCKTFNCTGLLYCIQPNSAIFHLEIELQLGSNLYQTIILFVVAFCCFEKIIGKL
jgi:hypothetical protein